MKLRWLLVAGLIGWPVSSLASLSEFQGLELVLMAGRALPNASEGAKAFDLRLPEGVAGRVQLNLGIYERMKAYVAYTEQQRSSVREADSLGWSRAGVASRVVEGGELRSRFLVMGLHLRSQPVWGATVWGQLGLGWGTVIQDHLLLEQQASGETWSNTWGDRWIEGPALEMGAGIEFLLGPGLNVGVAILGEDVSELFGGSAQLRLLQGSLRWTPNLRRD
jgi:hypothetical protein